MRFVIDLSAVLIFIPHSRCVRALFILFPLVLYAGFFSSAFVWFIHGRLIEEQLGVGVVHISFFSAARRSTRFVAMVLQQ